MFEVESNAHDYIGFFDENYLKKIAVSNLSLSPTDEYKNFFNNREVIEDLELDEQVNETTTQYFETDIENRITNKREQKKKVSILGRYKSFDLEDLEDLNTSKNLLRSK